MTTVREHAVDRDETRQGLQAPTRVLLVAFVVLTLVATNQLFVLARRTATLFSWTVQPPLSAAFLGASYAAGCVLSVLALRSRSWRTARVPLVTVLVFAVLTLLATLLHLDRFHFAAPGLVARAAAWIWLTVYLVVPVALLVVVLRQARASRSARADRAPGRPLPRWLVGLLVLQGAVLGVVGVALLVVPGVAARWWPWTLTPLTARMIAAWLVALAVAALLSLRADVAGVTVPAVAYVAFALLQLLALVLYGEVFAWGSAASVVYLGALVVSLATGVAGLALARRSTTRRTR
ncbi:hypothetical protein [Microlunatus flavus]|uniref:Uncharacterized protein n=1 Tax=Microlunatus flavus TaxID=1036181 RepID=A0A1H9A5G5_9ACTN|nr:hypothetical protein [Microlunatus flavus]SEP71855.1 hypothetical protein SAMN05421756_101480 [Microlunatus flavus]